MLLRYIHHVHRLAGLRQIHQLLQHRAQCAQQRIRYKFHQEVLQDPATCKSSSFCSLAFCSSSMTVFCRAAVCSDRSRSFCFMRSMSELSLAFFLSASARAVAASSSCNTCPTKLIAQLRQLFNNNCASWQQSSTSAVLRLPQLKGNCNGAQQYVARPHAEVELQHISCIMHAMRQKVKVGPGSVVH